MEYRQPTKRPAAGLVFTILFSMLMTFSGAFFLASPPKVVTMLADLGYPAYLAKILGVAKLLGVAALWLPVPRRFREWAYAGFTIDLVGATVSHLLVEGPSPKVVPALFLFILLILSHRLRHAAGEGGEASTSAAARAKLGSSG